jgi:apolipoprotein N-acyltransferase
VQGHPPCPAFPCTSTRQEITANHLALTADLDPGPDLVVWGESSAGFATDPGTNPAVAEGIAAETTRLDAHLLMGSDRPLGTLNFANSNMLFSPAGQLLGEYLKQHPVPFGEYVPLRGLIGDIPPFTRQPRDMVPGTGPVILDVDGIALGTVISYEGAFGRYAREHAALGAELLVVSTNQGSFGRSAAADQFIAMTSMRSAELGLDVVHAAVSGRSTIITDGGVPGPRTALYEDAVIEGTVTLRDAPPTPYARFGDWLVSILLLAAGATFVREAVRRAAGEPSAELDPVDV